MKLFVMLLSLNLGNNTPPIVTGCKPASQAWTDWDTQWAIPGFPNIVIQGRRRPKLEWNIYKENQ